jgi:hypothetical protein
MRIQVDNFVPFEGQSKAYKGKFDVSFEMESTKMKVRDCQFFNNGEKFWANFPDKKKQVDGKWQHDYSLVEIHAANGDNDVSQTVMKKVADAVMSYLKDGSIFDADMV